MVSREGGPSPEEMGIETGKEVTQEREAKSAEDLKYLVIDDYELDQQDARKELDGIGVPQENCLDSIESAQEAIAFIDSAIEQTRSSGEGIPDFIMLDQKFAYDKGEMESPEAVEIFLNHLNKVVAEKENEDVFLGREPVVVMRSGTLLDEEGAYAKLQELYPHIAGAMVKQSDGSPEAREILEKAGVLKEEGN